MNDFAGSLAFGAITHIVLRPLDAPQQARPWRALGVLAGAAATKLIDLIYIREHGSRLAAK